MENPKSDDFIPVDTKPYPAGGSIGRHTSVVVTRAKQCNDCGRDVPIAVSFGSPGYRVCRPCLERAASWLKL